MAKAAKAPAKKTSPIVWAGIVAAVVVAYTFLSPGDAPTKPSSTTKTTKKTTTKVGEYTQADYDAQQNPFPMVTLAAVDAFNPLIKKQIVPKIEPVNKQSGGIPPEMTGGEPNWFYTGCPATDGVRTALFENTATGESVYVKAGDAFKAARVQSVDVSTVVLVGPNGASASVPIVPFGETPGGGSKSGAVASNANAPLPVGAIGPLPAIGGQPVGGPKTITLSNGQTVQLPANVAPGNGNDLNVTPDTNYNNNGRRRRGRNRNRNFGDSTDGS